MDRLSKIKTLIQSNIREKKFQGKSMKIQLKRYTLREISRELGDHNVTFKLVITGKNSIRDS